MLFLALLSCGEEVNPNMQMAELLSTIAKSEYTTKNSFCSEAKLEYSDSVIKSSKDFFQVTSAVYNRGTTYLELGQEQESVNVLEDVLGKIPPTNASARTRVLRDLAIAYLRLGERNNCVLNHSGDACVFPIAGDGIHHDKTGSAKAIEIYQQLLRQDSGDLESRWLLNLAYMTVGGYPQDVPKKLLLKGLDEDNSAYKVKPFTDVAMNIGLNTNNMAGGNIVDDFNNDGYFDIITSSWGLNEGMHYCKNNQDGSFTDVSLSSGLQRFGGGLNMMQTDYNNDGLKDIFVLRGAWKGEFGKEPNSLLRNNGDGTFTDVTIQSGLLSFHPTQTATWADFNNDGWLDVFIGNESNTFSNPSELYINSGKGTFTNIAEKAGCDITLFVKGVTSGDYDNDGYTDIFVSTLHGGKVLFRNESAGGTVHFKDVTKQAGLMNNDIRTFPTWFWDYDNDGWLDILVCDYEIQNSLAVYAAREALNLPIGNAGKVFLYKNNHNGTFTDVSVEAGLTKIAFAMGANFGDIDNDGYLDIYLGTGNPNYQSLVPNKMFKNIDGKKFADVTTSSRTGNLQKGHGVSFADLDNDGDQDIYVEMGGAYKGDAYQNSLYINPGQNNNNWIDLLLEGTKSNRAAIGTKIKVSFTDNGIHRSVYRDVNSGGSFGSNPLQQHIGIGQAVLIESIEIKWPGSGTVQVFKNIQPGGVVKIKEGSNTVTKVSLIKSDFTEDISGTISCAPQ